MGEKGNSSGSAFSIHSKGVWLTARHVVDGCDSVGLQISKRRATKIQKILVHPSADIAVLWTGGGKPGIAISHEELQINQSAFHVGFPEGAPGQVVSSLIGRRNMRTIGRYRQTEPVVAWVERVRHPQTRTLGGLSGGPALNAGGEIVGVTVAASKRRGRVFTTAPITLASMFSLAGIKPEGNPSGGLQEQPTDRSFVLYGKRLRAQLIVAKVICLVNRTFPRRPIMG